MFEKDDEYILSIDGSHQLYLLEWYLELDSEVEVGKLGSFLFSKGTYVYVGSAKKNIKARVMRHLKREKKQRWHMDYLRPYIQVVKAISFPLHKGECSMKDFVEEHFQGFSPVKGFGSSDCRCTSHLLKLPREMDMTTNDLRESWKKWG